MGVKFSRSISFESLVSHRAGFLPSILNISHFQDRSPDIFVRFQWRLPELSYKGVSRILASSRIVRAAIFIGFKFDCAA